MEIRLELSDSLVEVAPQVAVPRVWQRHVASAFTFVESHRLLLAQSLAVSYRNQQLQLHQAGAQSPAFCFD